MLSIEEGPNNSERSSESKVLFASSVCASESTLAVLRLPPRVEFGVDDPEVLFEPEPPGRRVNEVARSSPSRFGMNLSP